MPGRMQQRGPSSWWLHAFVGKDSNGRKRYTSKTFHGTKKDAGIALLAMSIGLIRSETASELRTLTAAGASSRTRRTLTAVKAGGLAFLGALLGTVAAYVGLAGWFHTNALEGGVSDIIDHIPWDNLFLIVIAMPVVAALVGWVLAGRDPTGISTRPME
ncbi:MAG: FtsX-like permease family protein [Acidimicrobiales bacterium]